ncbi:1-phosphatidylinositol-3-phosphate 5-kinase [Serendipita sp. 397]|nr:1-phosphatidylinositol-3-phosphate 5-kinase [Serendipita sp. 397]
MAAVVPGGSAKPRIQPPTNEFTLTSFNPFQEEDELDQSSYAYVSSLFSIVKNTFTVAPAAKPPSAPAPGPQTALASQPRIGERKGSLQIIQKNPAPPLVSVTPVISEAPSLQRDIESPVSRTGLFGFGTNDATEGPYGTAIPGFPIADDARSIKTSTSVGHKKNASVSKVIRRLRGEGLSRDYWMDDETCKECYDCKSAFTTWRRKHHCRICGQIFCSRCASNIIKGSRFGAEGMIRICNICLKTLEDDTIMDDEEDDRRSVVSSAPSLFANHQYRQSLEALPTSPFSASQTFRKVEEPFSLFSIAETKGQTPSENESEIKVEGTSQNPWEVPVKRVAAPFRRAAQDEEGDSVAIESSMNAITGPISTPANEGVVFPVMDDGGMSSIQFPGSSPEQGGERPGLHRTRVESDVDPLQTPFMRSRVQSRLADLGLLAGEAGWRTRRESTAYAQEVNSISMFHIRLMLKQMLTTEKLPNVKEWEDTLLKLAMQIARDLVLTTGRRELDMDVRRFVKIKRIPGGSPKDSEYIDGAVITKNVTHKRMPRQVSNPRIVFVTFPFDYHRVEGQFVAFDPLVAQEDEYLKNLVLRVGALRPHILLVEKTVSRRALDYLHKANIAVARNVKSSAIQHVARMTQGDIISSMDRLVMDPKLGHCGKFKIQTFEHPLIPGKRKTFMRFEGCNRDLGCTIILRGGDIQTLTRVKRVTRFLAFLVRNLKMETFLWKDSVVTMPPLSRYAVPTPPTQFSGLPIQASGSITPVFGGFHLSQLSPPLENLESMQMIGDIDESDLPGEDAAQLRLSRRIQHSIEPYYTTFISVSATLRFPPPYPIAHMKQLDDRLRDVKRRWEDEVVRREEMMSGRHTQETTITPGLTASNLESPLSTPPILEEAPSYFEHGLIPSATASSFGSIDHSVETSFASFSIDANPIHLKQLSDIAIESELALTRHEHTQAQAVWEWYLRRNKDDFVVEKYQRITYRTYTVPFADVDVQMPCFMPEYKYVSYYGNNDCALGVFIEESCVKYLSMKPGTLCAGKGCGKPMIGHGHVFVHNQIRLLVAIEPWQGTIAGQEGGTVAADCLTTWSVCRLCGSFTPFIPVSLETQQYSFAKFLELHFYPADVMLMQGAGCMHNIYQHHVRYFAWKGLTIRFQSDPVVSFEPIFPSPTVFVRPDVPLQLKNHDYEHLLLRNAKFWQSVEQRLRWYDLSSITAGAGEKPSMDDDPFSPVTKALLTKAEAAKQRITQAIHSAYSQTFITDTLAFGKIRQELQEESTIWEKEFEKLDDMRRPPPPTFFDKDLRRSVAIPSRFKGMFGGVMVQGGGNADIDEKQRRPSITETEADSTDVDSTAPRDVATADEKSSILQPRPSGSTLVDSPIKETDKGGESDSTINATQVASRQPSRADLRAPSPSPPRKEAEVETSAEPNHPQSQASQTSDIVVTLQAPTPPPDEVSHMVENLPSTSIPRASRLPRRVHHSPRIALLVQQFQQPDSERTNGGMSESEIDIEEVQAPIRPSKPKSRLSQSMRKGDGPLSDFEGSYAANVAPLYFAHRRPAGRTSRIPGPVVSGSEGPSRKASPERPTIGKTIRFGQGFRSFEAPTTPIVEQEVGFSIKGKGKAMSNPSVIVNRHKRANTLGASKVSKIAKQYEKMARDAEKNRRATVMRNRKARPVATAQVTIEVLKTVKEGFADASESSSSSSEADDEDEGEEVHSRKKPLAAKSLEDPEESTSAAVDLASSTEDLPKPDIEPDMKTLLEQQPPEETLGEKVDRPSSPLPLFGGIERVATLPNLGESDMNQPERNTVLKAISIFRDWASRPIDRGPDVVYPGSKAEHFFRESRIAVREDEPTSFIAFALDSLQYRDYLASRKRALGRPSVTTELEGFGGDEVSVAESGSNWGFVSLDAPNPKDLLREEGPALEVKGTSPMFTFTTDNFQFKCVIYLTEQFDALRSICRCEKDLISSLSRCVKWDAGAGKSGSAFLKTRDDRYIAKEISRFEGDAFGEIGPAYFSYLAQAFSTKRSTLLAKIFGLYTIEYRHISTEKKGDEYVINGGKSGKTIRMNFLVMENLFYGRRFSKIYDLKGSRRNRHVNYTGKANEVLLDENLVQMTHAAPFYLHEHGKRMLRGALWNDTKFLQSVNVMDYSLLVGVDDHNNELVLGIVDYIRTFTWDKRIENWVKDFGGGKEPTIVTPRQYKQRFRSAMERYFPLASFKQVFDKEFILTNICSFQIVG